MLHLRTYSVDHAIKICRPAFDKARTLDSSGPHPARTRQMVRGSASQASQQRGIAIRKNRKSIFLGDFKPLLSVRYHRFRPTVTVGFCVQFVNRQQAAAEVLPAGQNDLFPPWLIILQLSTVSSRSRPTTTRSGSSVQSSMTIPSRAHHQPGECHNSKVPCCGRSPTLLV